MKYTDISVLLTELSVNCIDTSDERISRWQNQSIATCFEAFLYFENFLDPIIVIITQRNYFAVLSDVVWRHEMRHDCVLWPSVKKQKYTPVNMYMSDR